MPDTELDDAPESKKDALSCLPHIFACIYQASFKGKGDARNETVRVHNLYFYNNMMEEIRDSLDAGRFASYKAEKLYGMTQGEQS